MASRRLRPWIVLVLALLCGAAAAMLAVRYLRQQATPLMAESPRGRVAVASRNLQVGTVLTTNDVKLVDWPSSSLPVGYVASTEGAVGRGLMRQVQENEPFLESKLAPKGAGGGLQVSITEGMRAMSVRVDEVVGVAGFVLPDTRVDVLLTLEKAGNSNEAATEVLLQNVRTLAAGQEVQQDKDGKPKTVPVITLLVTPEQAETLALAANQGRIQLALRNTLDTLKTTTRGTRLGALFGSPPPAITQARRGPVIRVQPVPAPDSTVVEVYKGGARSLLKF